MKNNKQWWLTVIRMDMNILKYDDEKMKELYGKTYKQIATLNNEDIKEIQHSLHEIYLESVKEE